jgi:hypothetical protein
VQSQPAGLLDAIAATTVALLQKQAALQQQRQRMMTLHSLLWMAKPLAPNQSAAVAATTR